MWTVTVVQNCSTSIRIICCFVDNIGFSRLRLMPSTLPARTQEATDSNDQGQCPRTRAQQARDRPRDGTVSRHEGTLRTPGPTGWDSLAFHASLHQNLQDDGRGCPPLRQDTPRVGVAQRAASGLDNPEAVLPVPTSNDGRGPPSVVQTG